VWESQWPSSNCLVTARHFIFVSRSNEALFNRNFGMSGATTTLPASALFVTTQPAPTNDSRPIATSCPRWLPHQMKTFLPTSIIPRRMFLRKRTNVRKIYWMGRLIHC
jgi:hypothetical protein